MRKALVLVGVVGFFWLLGAAGSFDAAVLPFAQVLPRCLWGLAMLIFSCCSVHCYDRIASANRRRAAALQQRAALRADRRQAAVLFEQRRAALRLQQYRSVA